MGVEMAIQEKQKGRRAGVWTDVLVSWDSLSQAKTYPFIFIWIFIRSVSLDKRRLSLSPLSRRNTEETDTGRTKDGAAEMPPRERECLLRLTAPASSENSWNLSPVRGDFSSCFRTPGKNEPVKENKLLFLYSVLNKSGWGLDTCGAEVTIKN